MIRFPYFVYTIAMRRLSFVAPMVLVFLLLPLAVFAQNRPAPFPRLVPDPVALEYFERGVRNNGFSWMDLAEISIWASGAARPAPYIERINALARSIPASPDFPSGERERAEFILTYLHRNVFRAYALTQTRVDTVFTNGRFNCVSSSVLYMLLAKSIGLEVSGVKTIDHAFVMVHIGGEDIDVETTSRHGFDPGNRREFHDEFGRVTGFVYVPAQNYHDRQTITPIELVSLIMTNRISDLETRRRFPEAVPLAVDRAALLTGNAPGLRAGSSSPFFEDPRNDLMNRLFNYGAFLLNSGREEETLRWAAFASSVYPDEIRWQEFVMAAVNNRLERFLRAGHIAQARTFLAYHTPNLTPENFTQLDNILFDTELLNSANRIRTVADGNSVINAIDEGRSNGRLDSSRAAELLTFAVQRTATVLSAAPGRDWLAAITFIEGAIDRFGSNRDWEQALQTYRHNRAADFHNRFAAAWNRRNFDEARLILDEGLAEFPTNRQLLSNRDVVNRHLAQTGSR